MRSRNIIVKGAKQMEISGVTVRKPTAHQIICKGTTSLISMGSEVYHYLGNVDPYQHWAELLSSPFVAGYCSAGVVVDAGNKVTDFKIGDRVYGGIGHREYFVLEESQAQRIPDDITYDQACFTTLLRTGMYTAFKGRVHCGSSVIIIGCGLLGLSSLQFCRIAGATRIIAVEPNKKRAELAGKLGATHVFNCRVQDLDKAEMLEILGGHMADTTVDAAGQADTFASACELTRNNGDLCLISDPPDVRRQSVGCNMLIGYLNVHGIFINMMIEEPNAFYPMSLRESHEAVYEYIRDGRLKVDDMITDHVRPQEVIPLMPKLAEDIGEHVGIVIDWSKL